jgi:NADH:ubiquinone oxidoreductase subunit 3 (subunit A)
MGDILVIFLIQNVLIFVIIFWFLTWGAEYFYTKKNHITKKQFYECGFRTLSELNIQINLNFSLLCVFLILYDVEFTFLFPILFNFSFSTFWEVFILFLFLYFIIISLYYDYLNNSLSWQY